jgi:hypothetical protein
LLAHREILGGGKKNQSVEGLRLGVGEGRLLVSWAAGVGGGGWGGVRGRGGVCREDFVP